MGKIKPGKFITFEGVDGSGKSTQLQMMVERLRSMGIDVLSTREPGGTPLGRRIRESFLETEESVDPTAELLLFAADRAQHVNFLIKPAIQEGRIVISDRFSDSTKSYQKARFLDPQIIDQIINIATGGLAPDLTVYYDLPVEDSLLRTGKRASAAAADGGGEVNRMDNETRDFYERVRTTYLKIAADEPERVKIIDATGSIEAVHVSSMQIINRFFRDSGLAEATEPLK